MIDHNDAYRMERFERDAMELFDQSYRADIPPPPYLELEDTMNLKYYFNPLTKRIYKSNDKQPEDFKDYHECSQKDFINYLMGNKEPEKLIDLTDKSDRI